MVEKEHGKGQQYGDLKIVWHGEKLKSFARDEVAPPIYIRIKPINQCNHNCFYCVYDHDVSGVHGDTNRLDSLPREKMLEILSNLKEMGVKAVTYSGGGEPLIYPYIEEVLQKTREYGIDLSIITNGQQLTGKKAELLKDAKWVRVSTDSCDAQTFSQIRNRPENWFYTLAKNIQEFAKIKNPNCVFGINFVVHKKNKDSLYDSVKFYKELGVNSIKFSPMWHTNFFEYHAPIKESVTEQLKRAKQDFEDENFAVYDTYEKDLQTSEISNRTYTRCYIMQTIPVIGADQKVYFCHNKAYSKNHVLGSIADKSFKELWFSPEAAERFKTFNPKEECDHQCTNNSKNILINSILECGGDHLNFV